MTVTKIALTGQLRSGKSALTNYATTFYDFQPFAFASELKRTFHHLFPNIKRDPKPREYYQRYGQLMRQIDENVWIDATMRDVERYIKSVGCCGKCGDCTGARVLIEDVRQPNEIERLKSEGFVIIRITAPVDLRIKRALEAGDDFTVHDLAHETEVAVDSFEVDYEILNDSDLTNLYEQFDKIADELGLTK